MKYLAPPNPFRGKSGIVRTLKNTLFVIANEVEQSRNFNIKEIATALRASQ